MFKVDDIVYCIDNFYTIGKPTSSILIYLEKNKPYTISDVYRSNTLYILKEIRGKVFTEYRFISDKKYKKSLRKEKINKINKYENFKKK